MKTTLILFILILFTGITTFGQQKTAPLPENKVNVRYYLGMNGNNLYQLVQDKKNPKIFIDSIDDTINFTKIIDNIFKDKAENYYILTVRFVPINSDTLLFIEYFKNVTHFLDIGTYKLIKNRYFENKGKVYMWWAKSDGDFPCEIIDADPKTFVPFDSVYGGFDTTNVFYSGATNDFKIILGADPNSIKVLCSKPSCRNCGNCYFIDKNSVYYGFNKIQNADPKTFKLLNQKGVDSEDKNGKYFEGQLVK